MLGPEGREAIHKALGKNINTGIMQVLHEPGKSAQSNSYMWLYRTSGDTGRPIVLYDYQPGRGACYPKAFLNGFRGYLHTDGYDVYHSLPDEITVVGCWAHARRKFDEAVKSLPKGKAKNSSAAQGLAYCNLLFKMEEGLADLPPKERYDQRLEQAKPVLDALLAWANTRTAAPKSSLGKALSYLKEQWLYLLNYLKDGRLELSSNRAERSIKPGQQQLKLGEKDIKETLRIQGGGKALFLDTEPAAKISVLAKGQSGFAQNVQVEGGHIFAGSGCVLGKNDIQAPVELVFDSPVLAYRIGKTLHIGNRREKIPGICCGFIIFADRCSYHADSLQTVPFCSLRRSVSRRSFRLSLLP